MELLLGGRRSTALALLSSMYVMLHCMPTKRSVCPDDVIKSIPNFTLKVDTTDFTLIMTLFIFQKGAQKFGLLLNENFQTILWKIANLVTLNVTVTALYLTQVLMLFLHVGGDVNCLGRKAFVSCTSSPRMNHVAADAVNETSVLPNLMKLNKLFPGTNYSCQGSIIYNQSDGLRSTKSKVNTYREFQGLFKL